MANFYGIGRTNYVRFANLERVNQICDIIGAELVDSQKDGDRRHALLFNNGFVASFQGDDGNEYDTLDELASCLADGEVLVAIESGHEKLRYITGWATVINTAGNRRSINLDTIYEIAKEIAPPNSAVTRAEY